MWDKLRNLSDKQKGIILMVAGFVLLLHTLEIIERGLDYIIIISALMMIVTGFMQGGFDRKIQKLMKQ